MCEAGWVAVIAEIEEVFGLSLAEDEIPAMRTIAEVWAVLDRRFNGGAGDSRASG
ncbi:hypothetical protein ACWIGI_40765 [Nocardia sp. NPDC055321]